MVATFVILALGLWKLLSLLWKRQPKYTYFNLKLICKLFSWYSLSKKPIKRTSTFLFVPLKLHHRNPSAQYLSGVFMFSVYFLKSFIFYIKNNNNKSLKYCMYVHNFVTTDPNWIILCSVQCDTRCSIVVLALLCPNI